MVKNGTVILPWYFLLQFTVSKHCGINAVVNYGFLANVYRGIFYKGRLNKLSKTARNLHDGKTKRQL